MTASSIRRILVAIRDPSHAPRLELRKAAEIARAFNARIELFHAVDLPQRSHALARKRAGAIEAQAQAAMQLSDRRLQRFAGLAVLRGLRVTWHSNSDFPPHEAVIRRATRTAADLVVAGARARGRLGRSLLGSSDWELIRQCPCPLLLVKCARPYSGSVLLAAVDPFHAHAKPADLDRRLLQYGGDLVKRLQASLHVFHAYAPLVEMAPTPAGPVVAFDLPPQAQAAHTDLIVQKVLQLAASAAVPARACHVQMGPVAGELCALAGSLRASLVVMGGVSRSGLRRIFIGATAERVLDELKCDVLVVKPRGFSSAVGQREHLLCGAAVIGRA
ncbi:MAG TPA: universal stress protein [Steroidobacteraceae bacterium]|nr:universal stress protein [Steroidobacteraceae bacterium]